MKKKIKMWYARWFKVITNQQAREWGLTHYRNIHGDEINTANCRSLWEDKNGRLYRVRMLHTKEQKPVPYSLELCLRKGTIVRTENGCPVKIGAFNYDGANYPLIGWYNHGLGWIAHAWYSNGKSDEAGMNLQIFVVS